MALGDFIDDTIGKIPIVGDAVSGVAGLLGSNSTGTASIVSSLAGLGQQLLANGVREDQLQYQREQLALQERAQGFTEELAKRKQDIDVALAAIGLASKSVPDRSQEVSNLQQRQAQGAADTNTQLSALDRLVGRFSNAVR